MPLPLYLATPSSAPARDLMSAGGLGQMVTPYAGNARVPGALWALDNGCFSTAGWTPDRWLATLDKLSEGPIQTEADALANGWWQPCLFAVVPDVVGDAAATDSMWVRWFRAVIRNGFRPAYVAQDGAGPGCLPPAATALFIGGSTEWKLGVEARRIVAEAHRRGMWVHMGRVNSERRLRYASDIGCHSVDGTFLAFGPDINLPRLQSWLNPAQPSLW